MPLEIERKFALRTTEWKRLSAECEKVFITQGYLIVRADFHVRVRIAIDESKNTVACTLTTKVGSGVVREEHELAISYDHAQAILDQCDGRVIQKIRLTTMFQGVNWELDYFPDQDMAVAEVEIPTKNTKISKPDWVGREVSGQKKYSNIKMALEAADE